MDAPFCKKDFLGGIAYLLTSAKEQDAILGKLTKYYHQTLFKPYGRNIVKSVTEEALQGHGHLVRYNIGAPRIYLFLTIHNGLKMCLHITEDSAHTPVIHSVKHRFDSSLYETDTLLEGSLVHGLFLVDDIPVYDGHTTDLSLEAKLQLLNGLIDTKYRPDPILAPYRVALADHVEYRYLQSFVGDYLSGLSYKDAVKGLIFVPLDGRMLNIPVPLPPRAVHTEAKLTGRDVIKNPRVKSCCFHVEKTDKPDVYRLSAMRSGQSVFYDYASVPDKECSLKLHAIFRHKRECLMICHYDDTFERWKPHVQSCRKVPDDLKILS